MRTGPRKPIKKVCRGQSFVCQFKHPISGKKQYLNLGEGADADENLRALNAIFLNQENWRDIPDDTPEYIRKLWRGFTEVEPSHAVEGVAKAEADFWRRQYEEEVRAGMVKDAELAELRGRRYSGPTISLREAEKAFMGNFSAGHLDDAYRDDVRFIIAAFVASFNPDAPISDLSGQESEMRAWIERRKCEVGRMQQMRGYIIRFLEESGLSISRRAFRSWRSSQARPIVWLTDEQVAQLAECLPQYARDLFTVQVETGLRPTELATVEAKNIHGKMLVLAPLTEKLTLKMGSRTIPLSEKALEVLSRRTKGRRIAFPNGKAPWATQKYFCARYLKWLNAGKKAAEAKPGAKPLPPIDCRTGRRTAASLWLRRGLRIEQVAALLGDDVRTVRRHYARLLPQEVEL